METQTLQYPQTKKKWISTTFKINDLYKIFKIQNSLQYSIDKTIFYPSSIL